MIEHEISECKQIQRTPRPWLLVIIWLAFYLVTGGALIALTTIRPPGIYWWSWVFAMAQLAGCLWVRHAYYQKDISLVSFNGWPWAIFVIVSLQTIQYIVVVPKIGPASGIGFALLELFKFLVLIGYTEELWFRGIWFAMFKNRMLPSIIAGSVAFGIFHLPHGIGSVIISSCVGSVFAAARYRGASIMSLAIAHGLIDWLNNQMLPAKQLRISMGAALIVLPVACIAITILLVMFSKGKNINNRTISNNSLRSDTG